MQNHAAFCDRLTYGGNRLFIQTLRVMRLTALLLTIGILNVSAKGLSQSITFSGNGVRLDAVFQAIEKQSGYFILYAPAAIARARPVSVQAHQEALATFLQKIFADQPLVYTIKDNNIIVTEREYDKPSPGIDVLPVPPISGVIRDTAGHVLRGATVTNKRTQRTVQTNERGEFTIEAEAADLVTVSFIGYEQQTVTLSALSTIVLRAASSPLDEVQIIAYGQTSARKQLGNVTSVKAQTIGQQPVTNPLLTLQGRVPGLMVTQATGVPGGPVTVRIQGMNSIGSGREPFYVVDGVPILEQGLPGIGLLNLGTSPLSYLNPATIESIEVLKDADATAIYGSRAANGAILITTKKGKSGKTTTDLQLQQGFGAVGRQEKLLNREQYLALRRQAYFVNDALTENSLEFQNAFDLNGKWDTTRSTDWQETLLGGTASFTNLQASVSGGSEQTQFLVGANYTKEGTVFPGNFADQKGSLQFSITHTSSNKKFKLQLGGNFLSGLNRMMDADLVRDALQLPPVAPALYTPEGKLNWEPLDNGESTWNNPLAALDNKTKNQTDNLIGNLSVSYELAKNLVVKSTFGYNKLASEQLITSPLSIFRPEALPFVQRTARLSQSTSATWIIEPQLAYSLFSRWGDVNVLVGSTLQQRRDDQYTLEARGFDNDAQLENLRAAPTVQMTSNYIADYHYAGAFVRLNYSYRNRYLLNVSGRRDGSSRFGAENPFNNFYAVAAGWILSEEDWFEPKTLNFAKLKVSYGTTGNDKISDYRYLSLYDPLNPGNPYQGSVGLVPARHANPFIQWEVTKKFNAGIELGAWNNKVYVVANYFRNRSSNSLLVAALPSVTGFRDIDVNIPATVQNAGVEMSVTVDLIKGRKIQWQSMLTYGLIRNKLVKFEGLAENPAFNTSLFIGQPIDQTRVFRYAGVDLATGNYQFVDEQGKLTTDPVLDVDNTAFFYNFPRFEGGFSNTVRIGQFSIDAFVQVRRESRTDYSLGYFPGAMINQPLHVLDYWTGPGDQAASVMRPTTTFPNTMNLANSSTAVFKDAWYVRLKNVSVSYQLPQAVVRRASLASARVFVQAQNVATVTNYKGLDPETGYASLPPLRMITFGLHLTL